MTTTTHSTAAIMSLLDEAEWRQTQMDVGGLIQRRRWARWRFATR